MNTDERFNCTQRKVLAKLRGTLPVVLAWLMALSACGDHDSPPGAHGASGAAANAGGVGGGGSAGESSSGSYSDAGMGPGGANTADSGSGGDSTSGAAGAAGASGATVSGPDSVEDPGFGTADPIDYDHATCRLGGVPVQPDGAEGLATAGQGCSTSGALACATAASQDTLVCDRGLWQAFAHCADNQRCDRKSGVCAPLAPGCEGRHAGDVFCDGSDVVRCGPDRVSALRERCCGGCQASACRAPTCGDGQIEAPEVCDDGNTDPGDGCEPDCQPSAVLKLTAGEDFTCALLRGGFVRCWGGNGAGQLGLADSKEHFDQQPSDLGPVHLGARAQALAAGSHHACALLTDGSVQCWGENANGQLGLGHTRRIGDNEHPGPAVSRVPLGERATQVAAGGDTTCALLASGSVRCWGDNRYGQLGLGHTRTIGDDELPTAELATAQLGRAARVISVEGTFSCAIVSDYDVACWGYNRYGELGINEALNTGYTQDIGDDELPSSAPAFFAWNAKSPVDLLASGGGRSCVAPSLTTEFNCWGNNEDGGLGTSYVGRKPGTISLSNYVAWSSAPVKLGVGGGHLCTLVQDKNFFCWGLNAKGQIGKPYTYTAGGAPFAVDGIPVNLGKDGDRLPQMLDFALGAAHTCVLLEGNRVRCWGWNHQGQLGFGFRSAPPIDYEGGDQDHVPLQLPLVKVLPD